MLAARVRVPMLVLGVALIVVASLLPTTTVVLPVAFALLAIGYACYLRVGTVTAEPRTVAPPVRGRWVPINSPADKVPSHGLHAYGQTYAIDLVHQPEGEWKPELGWRGPHTRPPERYPGFGVPVLAPTPPSRTGVGARSP